MFHSAARNVGAGRCKAYWGACRETRRYQPGRLNLHCAQIMTKSYRTPQHSRDQIEDLCSTFAVERVADCDCIHNDVFIIRHRGDRSHCLGTKRIRGLMNQGRPRADLRRNSRTAS